MFKQWLQLNDPPGADRFTARIHEIRGGNGYKRLCPANEGQRVWAALIKQRFEKTCHRLGMNRQRLELILGQYWLEGLVRVAL